MSQENVKLPAKLSALPDRWIDKIFSRMEAFYGSTFIDKWRNTDVLEVKAVWANELANFSDNPECFSKALKELMDEHKTFPPSLPEFVELCRRNYVQPSATLLLPPPSPLSRDEAAKRANEIGVIVSRYPADGLGWAKMLRNKYLAGEKLLPIQISLASEALGEVWSMGKVEITERLAA